MLRVVIAIVVLGGLAEVASAQEGPITDSDWTLDLHDGAVLGSVRIVGMGGAQVALAQGSAGTLSNPAAPATRPPTSSGWWDWDFHLDALEAVYASDFDNNGAADEDRAERHLTFGIAGMFYAWGVALVGGSAETTVPTADGELLASASLAKLAVARSAGDETWSIGGAVRVGSLTIESATGPLFTITGAGLEGGVIYRPFRQDLRLGATGSLPITGTDVVEGPGCTLADCQGRVLPARVAVPWQLAIGGAWRLGPTRWNQWVAGRFRDERSLTVAADLVLTGRIRDGMGLEAFGEGQWQPSGRAITLGARAGAEWEALPGRLRLRGGTYWEPSRYDGVGGRPHLTAGVEVGFFTFRFWWNKKYRLRIGATGDFAPRFGNAGLSFGFWG